MFSTLIYIVLNLYQSLFSVSNFSYNTQIEKFNKLVEQNRLKQANAILVELRQQSLFSNKAIENRFQLLGLKLTNKQNQKRLTNYNEGDEVNDIIISSFISSKYLQTPQVNQLLLKAIIQFPNSDSLIYVYELLKSQDYNSQSNPKFVSYNSPNFIWNEAEALQLLDMMKKNEKLLL